MNTSKKTDDLGQVLGEWRVETPLPPRFKSAVWESIERQAAPDRTTLWSLAQEWLQATFSRPAVALAYCSVLLATGLGIGFMQGNQATERAGAQLEARYVQSIDPYRKVHP
jgi:hypothetical protein